MTLGPTPVLFLLVHLLLFGLLLFGRLAPLLLDRRLSIRIDLLLVRGVPLCAEAGALQGLLLGLPLHLLLCLSRQERRRLILLLLELKVLRLLLLQSLLLGSVLVGQLFLLLLQGFLSLFRGSEEGVASGVVVGALVLLVRGGLSRVGSC